ncbi:MAG: arginine--tRNA ligase [Treponemataceae bacterium]|nr:arginine--tRNA ligase [Spirochaetales bacterium]MDY6030519.1 arginine--tRNA ligase [Treponemataceae bacterium]
MADVKSQIKSIVSENLNKFIQTKGIDLTVNADDITIVTPPNPEMGDLGVPLFTYAKSLRMGPPQIAAELEKLVSSDSSSLSIGKFKAVGPYLNVVLDKAGESSSIIKKILEQNDDYGKFDTNGNAPLDGERVMIEFSSPNTNKPLHLGHLRNDALGESVSRCLKFTGAQVYKVNIINNRGVHICKSMLAYKKFHEANGDTPEKLGIKSDRFVGDCYVEFNNIGKKSDGTIDEAVHEQAEKEAQNMLVEWEKGNPEVHKLWKQMNEWAVGGVQKTYERTGVSFDKLYYESETYLKGKQEILDGLEKGIFFKADDGSVRIDVTEVTGKNKEGENQEKVMLRKDGTSVYITQDIGTAISRHNDWDFNKLIYVVGSEQIYHFKVLFYILKKLGFSWANQLYHLSYGMVNLPEGRMKSREGTVVDADDLIDNLRDGALEEISSKGREEEVGNAKEVAEKVALAALHYFLLQNDPSKDMIFNPKESLSFNGNTGPYLQYMGARICSIIRKADETGLKPNTDESALSLLSSDIEWELIKLLGKFPEIVEKAARSMDPSGIATYLYDLSKTFSRFYHDCPIITSDNEKLSGARLALAQCVKTVLQNGFNLVLIPFLEKM